MSVAIVTGSSGLIGSETVHFLLNQGLYVVGIDNNMRECFFGAEASTSWNTRQLRQLSNFSHCDLDIRDQGAIDAVFMRYGDAISLVVHTASQPSHDWAAKDPFTDFTVNANGTLTLLEATRHHCSDAAFIFTSTNKVYGDTPNALPLVERETRWEIAEEHPFFRDGIDETMSVDQSKHSLFGVSKTAADLLTQEYGRYFGLKTGVFRGGCLTGPAHSGTQLHGFLAYLVKCAVGGKAYTIFGHGGKQVRDNIHSFDLVNAFWEFFQAPRAGAVYNMGGSRHSNCSVLEAIALIEKLCGRRIEYSICEEARAGDHIWWVSDVRKFQADYPQWNYRYGFEEIVTEIVAAARERVAQGNA